MFWPFLIFCFSVFFQRAPNLGSLKTLKEKTSKQNVQGIVLGFFWGGGFCVCLFSLPKRQGMTRKKRMNKILAPTQSRDNPANLFMFLCFLLSLKTHPNLHSTV